MKKMNKITSAFLALTLTASATAVHAEPEEPSVQPGATVAENTDFPESPAAYQVTFVYEDAEAEAVSVSGNMQFYKFDEAESFDAAGDNSAIPSYNAFAYEDGMFNTGYGINGDTAVYEMTETEDGRFEVTIPLPGTLYYYDYKVTYADGTVKTIKDPANMPEANAATGHDAGHSLVYVGDENNTIKGQEYIYPREDHKGTVSFVSYTAADGTEQPLGVYLPYGYSESAVYNTLYVSHGGGGNENEWMTIGALANILDNLIAKGEIAPVVAVTMDNAYYAGSNGEPDRGGRTWLFDDITENFRSAIIPFVEENYSVNKDAEGRALCGLSMGSLTTSTILQYSTDLFNYYGCFSGANVPDMEVKDLEELKTKHIYLTAGMIDMAYYSSASGVRTTAGLKDKLDTLGVAYDIDVLGGAHDWGVWRESVTNFAKDHTWGKGYTGFRNDEGSEISLRKIDEKLYWFENGVQQGVCGDPLNIWDTQFDKLERGREIYDENSDAWYWLDANDNGAVACNKEVWMPYVIQGDGDPDGKWVRYDRYGQMIKGWYADDNGVYYYDLVTGAMAKGEKTINEKTYVFDEITGILK